MGKDNKCILCMGSNTDAEINLAWVKKELTTRFPKIKFFPIVETEPENVSNTTLFLNQLVELHTEESIEKLTACLKEIERLRGRTPEDKTTGIVKLDIDLLTYGDSLLRKEDMNKKYMQRLFRDLQ